MLEFNILGEFILPYTFFGKYVLLYILILSNKALVFSAIYCYGLMLYTLFTLFEGIYFDYLGLFLLSSIEFLIQLYSFNQIYLNSKEKI